MNWVLIVPTCQGYNPIAAVFEEFMITDCAGCNLDHGAHVEVHLSPISSPVCLTNVTAGQLLRCDRRLQSVVERSKAREGRFAWPQPNLGVLYDNGRGVSQDETENQDGSEPPILKSPPCPMFFDDGL